MPTHLKPDILECEVKCALGRITTNKAGGGDGIPVEPFQILNDDVVKVLHPVCQQIWKTQQWPQEWKRSVAIPVPKKGKAKEHSNYCTVQFSHSFVSDSLRSQGLQHARLSYPSPTPEACSHSCPSNK